MKWSLTAAMVLAASGAAWGAPRIDCGAERILGTDAEIVQVGLELGLQAVSEEGVEGTLDVGAFCRDFEGEIAYVVPAPRDFEPIPDVDPAPDSSEASELKVRDSKPRLTVPRFRVGGAPDFPARGSGAPSAGDEPAPSPARTAAAPTNQGPGCVASPGGPMPSPWAALGMLMLLGLRRRGARR